MNERYVSFDKNIGFRGEDDVYDIYAFIVDAVKGERRHEVRAMGGFPRLWNKRQSCN